MNSARNSNRVINLSFDSNVVNNNLNSVNNYQIGNRIHSSQPHLVRPSITPSINNNNNTLQSINNSKSFPVSKLFKQTQSIMSRSKSSQSEKKNTNKKIQFVLNTSGESRSAINVFENEQNSENTHPSKLILPKESLKITTKGKFLCADLN